MTNTSAAENLAGHPAEKEKVEKRRALGRGLESLLPGPRVVVRDTSSGGPQPAELRSGGQPGAAVPTLPSAVPQGGPAPQAQDSGAAGVQQIPFDSASPSGSAPLRAGSHFVRNDNASEASEGTPIADIQAVAEMDADSRAGAPSAIAQDRSAPHSSPTHSPETITIHASAEGRTPGNLVVNLPLDQIDKNPYQTRYLFDQELLAELAESIRVNGVVQPVMVRPGEDGRYVLILGERRCRASVIAGKTTIPAIVKRVSDQQAAEMTVVENLQRQDLNCLEQAEAFRVLSKEFRLTQQQIGERVGLSRESVSNYMRLLKLKQGTMEYLTGGALSFTDARLLLALEDPEIIEKAADEVVEKHLTGELIEDLVMRYQGFLPPKPGQGEKKRGSGSRWMDPNVRAAQTDMERALGLRVRIRDRNGRGKIVIEYSTVDDYERVVEVLRGKKG